MPDCESCGPDGEPRGVFIEIKGVSSRMEQENIYKIFKTTIKVIDKATFKVITIQQKEGMLYNGRRTCDKHETLFEIHGKITKGWWLLLVSILRSAYEQSFDVPWPSNPRRRRCPICEEWTLFKRNFPKELERWECCHMDGAERCGYSELAGGDWMIKDDIHERDLSEIVDVILVYGQASIIEHEENPKNHGKDERTLRAYQKKWPNIEPNLKHGVIEIINKHKLDERFEEILKGIPAAVTLAQEYKNKPSED